MPDNEKILTDLMNAVKTDVVNSMQSKGRYATGETIAALEVKIEGTSGKLLAPLYIDALEFGRKPTSQGAAQADPPLLQRIITWLAAKGLIMNPYAVTKKIHKFGYPGKPGVLTEPLEMADAHINEACEQIATNEQQKVLDLFKVLDKV